MKLLKATRFLKLSRRDILINFTEISVYFWITLKCYDPKSDNSEVVLTRWMNMEFP